MSSATAPNSVQLLADALSGQVLVSGDPGYDEARTIWPDGWEAPRPYIRVVPQPQTT